MAGSAARRVAAGVAVVYLVACGAAGVAAQCPPITPSMLQYTCQSQGLAAVPTGLPTSLQELNLHHNNITSLGGNPFVGLSRVVTLVLSNNPITSLPAGALAPLQSLHGLNLDSCHISTVARSALAGLTQLGVLQLQRNRIAEVPTTFFSGLGRLTTAFLYSNRITRLAPGAFGSGASSLRTLWLYLNSITEVPSGVFDNANLAQLTNLDLRVNAITTVADRAFASCTRLLTLQLAHNRLEAVTAITFAGLGAMQYLHLADNALVALPAGVFSHMPFLGQLFTYGNIITAVAATALPSPSALTTLYFSVQDLPDLAPWNLSPFFGENNTNIVECSVVGPSGALGLSCSGCIQHAPTTYVFSTSPAMLGQCVVATAAPTHQPSPNPTTAPTIQPTSFPSAQPSTQPTSIPTSEAPTAQPTLLPTTPPTPTPTESPVALFTAQPSPLLRPSTTAQSAVPPASSTSLPLTTAPSTAPSTPSVTAEPTDLPTTRHTEHPSAPTVSPSPAPFFSTTPPTTFRPTASIASTAPTFSAPPSISTSPVAGVLSRVPTPSPTRIPTSSVAAPSALPTTPPTNPPTSVPSVQTGTSSSGGTNSAIAVLPWALVVVGAVIAFAVVIAVVCARQHRKARSFDTGSFRASYQRTSVPAPVNGLHEAHKRPGNNDDGYLDVNEEDLEDMPETLRSSRGNDIAYESPISPTIGIEFQNPLYRRDPDAVSMAAGSTQEATVGPPSYLEPGKRFFATEIPPPVEEETSADNAYTLFATSSPEYAEVDGETGKPQGSQQKTQAEALKRISWNVVPSPQNHYAEARHANNKSEATCGIEASLTSEYQEAGNVAPPTSSYSAYPPVNIPEPPTYEVPCDNGTISWSAAPLNSTDRTPVYENHHSSMQGTDNHKSPRGCADSAIAQRRLASRGAVIPAPLSFADPTDTARSDLRPGPQVPVFVETVPLGAIRQPPHYVNDVTAHASMHSPKDAMEGPAMSTPSWLPSGPVGAPLSGMQSPLSAVGHPTHEVWPIGGETGGRTDQGEALESPSLPPTPSPKRATMI